MISQSSSAMGLAIAGRCETESPCRPLYTGKTHAIRPLRLPGCAGSLSRNQQPFQPDSLGKEI